MQLLAQLNVGDLIAQETEYHKRCLVNLYNRARKINEMFGKGTDDEHWIEWLVFAELVVHIQDALMDDKHPVFKHANLAQLCISRTEQLGVSMKTGCIRPVLSRDCLFTFLTFAQHQGRCVLLELNDDLGDALARLVIWTDLDAVHLRESCCPHC